MIETIMAILCAAILGWTLHPVMRTAQSRTGWVILCAVPVLALGLYTAIGQPRIPAAPALFETSGPRVEARQKEQKKLILLEALAGDPDNEALRRELEILD